MPNPLSACKRQIYCLPVTSDRAASETQSTFPETTQLQSSRCCLRLWWLSCTAFHYEWSRLICPRAVYIPIYPLTQSKDPGLPSPQNTKQMDLGVPCGRQKTIYFTQVTYPLFLSVLHACDTSVIILWHCKYKGKPSSMSVWHKADTKLASYAGVLYKSTLPIFCLFLLSWQLLPWAWRWIL